METEIVNELSGMLTISEGSINAGSPAAMEDRVETDLVRLSKNLNILLQNK